MQVLHVDDALIAVDKPAGLLAVPGRGEAGRHHLTAQVQALYPEAMVVHRLDMATSGLMLFARGARIQAALSAAWRERHVEKGYEAWVHGLVGRTGARGVQQGEIDLPLAADWPRRPRQRVDRLAGKPSLTRWLVLAHDERHARTRLELEPVTGRTHQLRVHLAAIGHAIVGDALYAAAVDPDGDAPSEAHDDRPDEAPRRPGADSPSEEPARRLLLHATRLALRHPLRGDWLELRSAAPF